MSMFKTLSDDADALGNKLAGLTRKLAETKESVRETREAVEEEMTRAQEIAQESDLKINQAINNLRSYLEIYADDASIWTQELELQLDAIAVGGKRLDEFLQQWGSAVITTEEGATTIREMFEGLDLRGKAAQVTALAADIQTGAADVTDAIEWLSQANSQYADRLREVLVQVQAGELPLKRLLAVLRALQEEFGDSAFGDLGKALEQAALEGRI